MTRQPWWPPELYKEHSAYDWDHEMHIAAEEREESLEEMDAAWRKRIEALYKSTGANSELRWFVAQLLKEEGDG